MGIASNINHIKIVTAVGMSAQLGYKYHGEHIIFPDNSDMSVFTAVNNRYRNCWITLVLEYELSLCLSCGNSSVVLFS